MFEWSGFERPDGFLAMDLTVRDAELFIDPSGNTATALYLVEMEAGFRWPFFDTGLLFEAYVKEGGLWKLTHQADSWILNFDADTGVPRDFFFFDWSYPVTDLTRAVDFYTPLLGEPEVVTDTRATFNMHGPRFHLDATQL